MKKLLILLSFVLSSVVSFGQFINTQTVGRNSTDYKSLGGLTADSVVHLAAVIFADTTAANYSVASKYSGALIQVASGQIWWRSLNPNQWHIFASSTGGSYVLVSDTSTMLTPYLRKSDTLSMLSNRLRISDTAFMLSTRVKYSDTANQMSGYVRKNFPVLYTDTASMLSGYARSANVPNNQRSIATTYPLQGGGDFSINRTHSIDTGRSVPQIVTGGDLNKVRDSLQANITASIAGVSSVSITTANGVSGSVLSPTTTPAITLTLGAITPSSVSSSGAITGTTLSGTIVTPSQPNITSVGNLSILTVTSNITAVNVYANNIVKYSDTASMLSNRLKISDTSNMLAGYGRYSQLVKYADTSTMLANYERNGFGVKYIDTAAMLSNRLKISDTTTMLSGYLRTGNAKVGTVTSVGLSLPSFITVTNSPITTSGTITGTLSNQSANLVFSGPTTGSAAQPTFRSLVQADIPSIYTLYTDTSTMLNGYLRTGNATVGTVTNVSITTVNGVSGSVLSPTTTPAISLTLGNITPTSISSSGAITGTTIAGAWGGSVIGSSYGGAGSVNGLMKANGSGVVSAIIDNSSNWNTAFTDRLKWDGGSTGLVAATGRASLGLGSAALNNTGDFYASGSTVANSTLWAGLTYSGVANPIVSYIMAFQGGTNYGPSNAAQLKTFAGYYTSGDNPTFGTITGTTFTGNAATVTTNANLTGPVTSVGNATTITVSAVTNAMLAGSIASSKLVGTDIVTVGTITSGIWNAGAVTSTGVISGATISSTGSVLANNISSTGSITGTVINGAGTGLTGTASGLSIGGTAGSETLATVTARGNSTSTGITVNNGSVFAATSSLGTVTTVMQSDNTAGYVGTNTNHVFNVRVNSITIGTFNTSGLNMGSNSITAGAATFANSVTATSLIKSGGTAAQFLKADGSVDANTYLTGNQSITLSGEVTGTGSTAITTTLATTIANPHTFSGVISLTSNTASSAYTNGALVVTGGIGASGALNTNGSITSNSSLFSPLVSIQTDRTVTQWLTTGVQLQVGNGSNIFTDNTTAASTTVATSMINTFARPTIAASNTGVVYTNSATVYISNSPAAGTNVTLTNPYALYIAAGNNYAAGNWNAAGFFNNSDTTLKNILSRNNGIGFDVISYKWKDKRDSEIHYGYPAQDVQKILPGAVNKGADGKLNVNYGEANSYKIGELEKQIAELKELVNSLIKKL